MKKNKNKKNKNFKEDVMMNNNINEQIKPEEIETPNVEKTLEQLELEIGLTTEIESTPEVIETPEEGSITQIEEGDTSVIVNENQNEVEESANELKSRNLVGRVTGCSKLYVREKPSKESEALTIIDGTVNVIVEPENSTDSFYKVTTSEGIEGYCVRDYISIE